MAASAPTDWPLERDEILALESSPAAAPARAARAHVRRAVRCWLCGQGGMRGLVLSAADLDGSPLLLVDARLASADSSVVLEYGQDTHSTGVPQSNYRVSVSGTLEAMSEVPALGRYIARFANRHQLDPAGMQDGGVALYHLQVGSVQVLEHETAARRLHGSEYRLDYGDAPDHTQREWDNLAHQNYQHLDINEQLATAILGMPRGRWLLTGIDPEGMDFRLGEVFCRLPFPEITTTQKAMGMAIKHYLAEARRRLNIRR